MASSRLNNVSQSAVSQGIIKLEEQLGVELIKHQKRLFILTPQGTLLVEKAREIFSRLDTLENQIDASAGEVSGELRIGASQSLAVHFLARSLGCLKKQAPKVLPVMKLGSTTLVKDWVRGGVSEVGLAIDKGGGEGLKTEILLKGYFVVVDNSESLKERKLKPFIVSEMRNEVASLMKTFSKKCQMPFPSSMIVESWSVICSLVQNGMGLGLVPDFMVSSYAKLREAPEYGRSPYEICVYYKNADLLSPGASKFIEILRENVKAR